MSCGSSYFIKNHMTVTLDLLVSKIQLFQPYLRRCINLKIQVRTLKHKKIKSHVRLILRKIRQRKQDFETLMDRVSGVWDGWYDEDDMDDGWMDGWYVGRVQAYLIFVIFFTQAKIFENKIYTEIYTVNCQFFALNLKKNARCNFL